MRVCRNVYSLLFIPYMYICSTRIEDRISTAALIQGRANPYLYKVLFRLIIEICRRAYIGQVRLKLSPICIYTRLELNIGFCKRPVCDY